MAAGAHEASQLDPIDEAHCGLEMENFPLKMGLQTVTLHHQLVEPTGFHRQALRVCWMPMMDEASSSSHADLLKHSKLGFQKPSSAQAGLGTRLVVPPLDAHAAVVPLELLALAASVAGSQHSHLDQCDRPGLNFAASFVGSQIGPRSRCLCCQSICACCQHVSACWIDFHQGFWHLLPQASWNHPAPDPC